MEYSIVIPTYNESDKITSSLTQVLGFMRDFTKSFEVIVVDDGSNDDTASLVQEYIKTNPEVKLIRNSHKGKGPTVTTGMLSASGAFVYMADADLSTPISELKKLSTWLIEHDFDIVIASREGSGAKRNYEPLYRHLMGRIFNMVVRVIVLPGIRDSQCGFKLFKNKAAKDSFSRLKVYSPDIERKKKAYLGAFDVEVLAVAKKLDYRIKELPVEWTYVKTSRLSPISDSINMVLDVCRIRINIMKGAYK